MFQSGVLWIGGDMDGVKCSMRGDCLTACRDSVLALSPSFSAFHEHRNKARYSTDAPGPQQFPLVALIHGIRVVCQTGNTENDGKKRL